MNLNIKTLNNNEIENVNGGWALGLLGATAFGTAAFVVTLAIPSPYKFSPGAKDALPIAKAALIVFSALIGFSIGHLIEEGSPITNIKKNNKKQ